MSFFTRYHVDYIKLPELRDSVKLLESDIEDCNNYCTKDSSGKGKDLCKHCKLKDIEEKIKTMKNGIAGWENVLNDAKDTLESVKKNAVDTSITNWFDKVGNENESESLKIEDHLSTIAPPALTKMQRSLTTATIIMNQLKECNALNLVEMKICFQ